MVAARVLAAEVTVVRGQPLVRCCRPLTPTDSAIGAAQTFRDRAAAAGFSELVPLSLAAGPLSNLRWALYSGLHPAYMICSC